MSEKQKRLLGVVILVLILIVGVIQYPAILEPVLYLIGIIGIVKIVTGVLNAKDRNQTWKRLVHKVPNIIFYAISILALCRLIYMLIKHLSLIIIGGGIVLAIFIGHNIDKNVKNDLDKDNIIDFKSKK